MWVPCDYPSLCTAAPSKKIGKKAIFFWGEGTAVHTVYSLDYPRVVIRLLWLGRTCNFLFFFWRAVWLNIPGLIIIVTLCCLDGLVIFAVYSGCDLGVQGKITSNDQVYYAGLCLSWFFFSFLIHNRMGIRSNCPKYICCRFERSHRC